MGLRIIKNTHDFEDGIKDWLRRPVADHTWANFKTHFEAARELLRKIRGADMANTAYHQANLIANSVRNDMEHTEQNLLQSIATLCAESTHSIANTSSANAVTTDATQLAILELLKALREDFKKKTPTVTRSNRLKHYCWTHGRCNHKSNECRSKKAGHQDDATLKNKKGGSNKNCNPQE